MKDDQAERAEFRAEQTRMSTKLLKEMLRALEPANMPEHQALTAAYQQGRKDEAEWMASDLRDAERYRFLRSMPFDSYPLDVITMAGTIAEGIRKADLDGCVDAAIQATKPQEATHDIQHDSQ